MRELKKMTNRLFPDLALDLQYLQAELARIDLLIRREIRRWRLAGQNPADTFRGMYVSDAEIDDLLERPFGSNWGETVALTPEEVELFAEAENQTRHQIEAIIEEAERAGQTLRLRQLAQAFNLDRFELDTLLLCLASTLDIRYERFYGYLQDDVTRKRPSLGLVLDLLGEPGPERLGRLAYFTDSACLFKYRLIERIVETGSGKLSALRQILNPDETIVGWLLGNYQPHPDLGPHATLDDSPDNKLHQLLAAEVWPGLQPLLHEGGAIFVFYGPDQASQKEAANLCAAEIKRPLLRVDLAGVLEAGLAPLPAITLALREARLLGALPFLEGWDACLSSAAGKNLAEVLAEIYAFPYGVILAGQKAWQPRDDGRERNLFWLEFPIPSYTQRVALWQHYLAADRGPQTAAQTELALQDDHSSPLTNNHVPPVAAAPGGRPITGLAGQFALTSAQIRAAVASARDMARQQQRTLNQQDLFTAARAYSNPNLTDLARKVIPRFGWPDIILPADQLTILHEIVATVRSRPLVLDTWGVGQKLVSSRGVTILFAGPPGTGKTMAAEVIAGELELDLYKIDLSTIVSKYIGETEKNLEKIFNEAASSNAILFFDEADAIFGKRSEVKDAHDRYANIEVSYLLQRMEAYDGVTILATNLRANLDDAFTRRLQFAVDFPFPERKDRLRIWQTLFPPDVPRDARIDFEMLAERFKLAGGNIRNIIVSAAYLAGADGGYVTMQHLLHGTRRELQKMGRLIGEEDLIIE
jgi:hypothetical protein